MVTFPLAVGSTEYLRVQVTATVNGAPYDPTADVVTFAFVPTASAATTEPSIWLTGSWEGVGTVSGGSVARCLVGPTGTFVPGGTGSWWVWLRIVDNPEVPVRLVGRLQVT